MSRIRSIKPEFPQSETIGKLSRDARLLFIQLWTIADDDGRARASSRMLASLLYPYDDDAPKLIEGWLSNLERTGCVRRYEIDGSHYLDIPNWLKHQKIDHPGKSKIPEYREPSPILARPPEALAPDLGPRTLDQDLGSPSLRSGEARVARPKATRIPENFVPDMNAAYEAGLSETEALVEVANFLDYWRSKPANATKLDWQATWRIWCRKAAKDNGQPRGRGPPMNGHADTPMGKGDSLLIAASHILERAEREENGKQRLIGKPAQGNGRVGADVFGVSDPRGKP